jgi:acyl-coenzyme A synthetase/AMP-(fatty) acid ligase
MAINELMRPKNINDIAFSDDTGDYSYAQLTEYAAKFASYLQSKDVGKGDIIIINILKNNIKLPISILGSIYNGTIPILLGYGKCGAISNQKLLSDTCKKYNVSLIIDDMSLSELSLYETVQESDKLLTDDCVIFVSSGTLGHPKYIHHTFQTILDSASYMQDLLVIDSDNKLFCAELLSHAYGFVMGVCVSLYAGLTTVLSENTDLNMILNTKNPDIFAGTPRHFVSLKNYKYPFVRLGISAGYAPLYELSGANFINGYGCTESLGFVLANGVETTPFTISLSNDGYLTFHKENVSFTPGDIFSYDGKKYEFIKRGR